MVAYYVSVFLIGLLTLASAAEKSPYETGLERDVSLENAANVFSANYAIQTERNFKAVRDHIAELDGLALSFSKQVLQMTSQGRLPETVMSPHRVTDLSVDKERLLDIYQSVEDLNAPGHPALFEERVKTDKHRILTLAFTVLGIGALTSAAIQSHHDVAALAIVAGGAWLVRELTKLRKTFVVPVPVAQTREEKKFDHFWTRVNGYLLGHGIQAQWHRRDSVEEFCDRLLEGRHLRVPEEQVAEGEEEPALREQRSRER